MVREKGQGARRNMEVGSLGEGGGGRELKSRRGDQVESWKGGTCPLEEGFTQGSEWEKTVCVLRATEPT